LLVGVSPAGWPAANHTAIEEDLDIAPPGGNPIRGLDLATALAVLHVPSISVALIDGGRLAWARVWGDGSVSTRYQAASLSKLVTAVAALRLVEQGRLALDRDVNADLGVWHMPHSELTRGHPVTLRGLLSMTGGIGVPGYLGYVPGTSLPNLLQILNGEPPANSAPIRVVYASGTRFAYSGGGYEVVQALIEAATHLPFNEALRDLVLRPARLEYSLFAQPMPAEFSADAARGHYDDGRELPGGWRVMPELAAGGLWSTATDLARLLIEIGRAYRNEQTQLISRSTALGMLTPQAVGSYGLGGGVAGSGSSLVLMKRGQNIGYQSYMLMFPQTGQGIVVLTGSDNGTTLATGLIRRAAVAYHWPQLGELSD
jgi:CubicO group peptidase (beta-lactamase class C family)